LNIHRYIHNTCGVNHQMHIMVNNKIKLDIGYGYMRIQVVSSLIYGYKEIIGQHWYKPNFLS
jgi:hypothetical protein